LLEFAYAFRMRHCSISVSVFDTVPLFNEVLDHPTKYGFTDAMSVCGTKECIWYDGIHPTFAMHKILANELATFLGEGAMKE
jgi:phospholipase/lecithinase/hemolysin